MSGMTRFSTLGFLLVGLAACQSAGEQKPAAQEQPRKPGKYLMYCSKKPPLMASHRERGMEGILEVLP